MFLLFIPSLCFADLSWERVSTGKPIGSKDIVSRAYVPHGWLVVYGSAYTDVTRNMIFVPDENHEWQNQP